MTVALVEANEETAAQPAPFDFSGIIHRLADEGVPIVAIARSLRIPSEDIRRELNMAMRRGAILEMPRDDWPPGSKRGDRGTTTESILADDDRLRIACGRKFTTTTLQSALLAQLLRRDQCGKEQLHNVIEQNRMERNSRNGHDDREMTDQKMVDVIICHIRRKLKPFDIRVKTIWGRGYMIEPDDRARAVVHLESLHTQAPQLAEAA